jgi:meiotically up-regulated gene 157 (Mug157) protein
MNHFLTAVVEWLCGRVAFAPYRNYEVDSLCYFLRLSYLYWQATKDTAVDVFDAEWQGTVNTIVDVLVVEQHHDKNSPYCYVELARNGLGVPSSYTGMTWTAFRPCTYPYLMPLRTRHLARHRKSSLLCPT